MFSADQIGLSVQVDRQQRGRRESRERVHERREPQQHSGALCWPARVAECRRLELHMRSSAPPNVVVVVIVVVVVLVEVVVDVDVLVVVGAGVQLAGLFICVDGIITSIKIIKFTVF